MLTMDVLAELCLKKIYSLKKYKQEDIHWAERMACHNPPLL